MKEQLFRRQQINVLLIMANRLIREALAKVLAKRGDLVVMGAFSNGAEALNEMLKSSPDVLVADSISFWPREIVSSRWFSAEACGFKALFVGMPDDRQAFLEAIRAGAFGYVLSDASALDVVGAIRSVAGGEAVCPPHFVALLYEQIREQARMVAEDSCETQPLWTRRELQLLPLIGEGLTNKEIASRLNISEQTVKNHIHRMVQKAGVNNRLELLEPVPAPA